MRGEVPAKGLEMPAFWVGLRKRTRLRGQTGSDFYIGKTFGPGSKGHIELIWLTERDAIIKPHARPNQPSRFGRRNLFRCAVSSTAVHIPPVFKSARLDDRGAPCKCAPVSACSSLRNAPAPTTSHVTLRQMGALLATGFHHLRICRDFRAMRSIRPVVRPVAGLRAGGFALARSISRLLLPPRPWRMIPPHREAMSRCPLWVKSTRSAQCPLCAKSGPSDMAGALAIDSGPVREAFESPLSVQARRPTARAAPEHEGIPGRA